MNLRPYFVCVLLTLLVLVEATGKEKETIGTFLVSAGKASSPGVHYSLPENYYVVALPVLSKTFHPGPFCGLAHEFFAVSWLGDDFFQDEALKTACKKQAEFSSYRVDAKTASIDVLSRPDPSQRYIASYGGSFNSNEFNFTLGQDGILNKGSQKIQSRKYEFFVSLLQTAASIAGKFFGAGSIGSAISLASNPLYSEKLNSEKVKILSEMANLNDPKRAKNTDCLRASTEFLVQDHYNFSQLPQDYKTIYCNLPAGAREEFMSLTESGSLLAAFLKHFETEIRRLRLNQLEALRQIQPEDLSRFFAAARLAKEWQELHEKNSVFINPQATDRSPLFPRDAAAFAAVLKSRQERVEEIERQFTGVFETETERIVKFEIAPKDKNDFTISPLILNGACGKIAPQTPTGTAYVFRWLSGSDTAKGENCNAAKDKTFSLSLKITEPVESPPPATTPPPGGNGRPPAQEPPGLAYRVPAWGLLTLQAGEQILTSSRVPIAQQGIVATLQARIGSGTSYQFALDPLTGSLREIAGAGEPAFTPERVKMLEGVADSVLGAATAAKQTLDPDPESRLSLLQRQTSEACQETRLVLLDKCKQDPTSASCELALKACP